LASLLTVAALAASAVLTSFLSGVLGMAGGMVLMGALLVFLPVADAMVLHGITQLAANGWRAWLWRSSIVGRILLGYSLGVVAVLIGFATVQLVLNRPMVLIVLGLTPFLMLLLPRRWELNVDRRGHPFACGAACMGLQLLSGVAGPLQDTFFVRSVLDRKAVVATKAAISTVGHVGKIAYFGALTAAPGIVDPWLASLMVACAVVGTSASRRLLERMSDAAFRNWTRRAVLTIAGFYLGSGVWALVR
jgi:uncharacterized membrane protein YfcA